MAEFLTSEWVSDLAAAAHAAEAPPEVRLVVQQVVADPGAPEVAYAVHVADGRISVTAGRAAAPDVTLTQDRETAAAIAQGELSAQAAFLAGRLKVGGDLTGLLAGARALAGLADVFAATRAATTW